MIYLGGYTVRTHIPKYESALNVLLKDLALRCLGIPEVHHLIQQLIDDDEVVAYRFFLKFFEVFNQDLCESMEEEDDLRGVGVAFGQS